jgi:tRNA (guanine26-N2/guanine27-N2)-dimethyltransferase
MADGASTSAAQASTSASEQASSSTATEPQAAPAAEPAPEAEAAKPVYQSQRFTIFEALSATGLRSIRYAREVPLLKWVLANDLSASAAAAMRRNVALNFPAGRPIKEWQPGEAADAAAAPLADEKPADQEASTEAEPSTTADAAAPSADASAATDGEPQIHKHCRVRVNEGDATDVLYTHRAVSKRFDVIDLDPYGSAVPFLDGAVQAVADGGLLCVTCTDLAVLAGSGHPEKAFSSYGGTVARVDYCHEVALRLVLHSIASAAARYGRTITPLLSLSIDFYVRVFVRVESKPIEVKRLACSTGTVSTCNRCGNFEAAPLGRERPEERGGQKFQPGYAASVGSMCKECGGQARFVVSVCAQGCNEQEGVRDEQHIRNLVRLTQIMGKHMNRYSEASFSLSRSRTIAARSQR